MENASKALIMAAGILIGISILTIASYLFLSFGEKSKNIQEQMDAKVIAEFNNNFLKYLNSDKCTIHDIVSLTNLAKRENNKADFNPLNANDRKRPEYINVYLKQGGQKDLTTYSDEDLIELLKEYSVKENNNQTDIQYFKCISIEFEKLENGKVKSITFQKK